jgi:hypothetical protein
MAPKQGLNIGDTDALLKSLNLPSQPKTFGQLANLYGQGILNQGPLKDRFIPPTGKFKTVPGQSRGLGILKDIANIGLSGVDLLNQGISGISALTNPSGNIVGDYLSQLDPEAFKLQTEGIGAGPEIFLPDDQTSSIPGSDIFTDEGQSKLASETSKALENLIGKSVGDVGAFDPQGEVDQATIDKLQEEAKSKPSEVSTSEVIDTSFDSDFDADLADTTGATGNEVKGADTPAKKATVKALDEFLKEARPGVSPKTFDEYINEFGEATGLDVSGEPDTKQALMSFGLALMQNRAGKGFNISNILKATGEAGESAMPDFRKAVSEAKAIRAKAGAYALSQRESDQKKAMDRKGYVIIPKDGGLQNSILKNEGNFQRLNSYELNNLLNDEEFNKNYEVIDSSSYTDMTKALITAANKNKKKVYLEKPKSIPLFGGSKIKFDVFYANPNNKTGAKNQIIEPQIALNTIATMEKGLNRAKDQFREIAALINQTGVTAGDQIRSFGKQLAKSFGIKVGSGETDPLKRLNAILTELKARNAADILGESGKTISDNDRRLVDEIVGGIDVLKGEGDIDLLKEKLGRLYRNIINTRRDEISEAYRNVGRFINIQQGGSALGGTKYEKAEDEQGVVYRRIRPSGT